MFLVLGHHMAPCPPESGGFLHLLTAAWIRGGWIGVDLFFVLSGFLVSSLLFREHERFGELHIGRFLIRRGLKIYPPFWLLIGITTLPLALFGKPFPYRALASELLFVQNYGPSIWNHTWSLAVEEHFYLLLAFSFLVLVKYRPTQPFASIPAAFIAIASLSLILRIAGTSAYDHKTHLYPSHLRLDSLVFGVLLSYLFHRHQARFLSLARRFRYSSAGMGVCLLAPAFYFPLESTRFIYTYGLTLFYIGSGCLVVSALGCRVPSSSFASATAFIGSHSYSVYLWHMPVAVGAAVVNILLFHGKIWIAYAAVYFLGSIVFGVGMAICTELPTLRLRDRLFPSRATLLGSESTVAQGAAADGYLQAEAAVRAEPPQPCGLPTK